MAVIHYYSRRGCHLCEIMLEELLPLLKGRAEIEMRDIDSRADWRERYDVRVPVVEFDGQIVSEYPLDHAAIAGILAQIAEISA